MLFLSLPYLASSLSSGGFVAMLPLVREEFMLSRTAVGAYTTVFFLSAALMAIITGNVVDRLGSKKGIVLGMSGMGVAMLLYGLAPSYLFLLGLVLLAGFGFSIITPAVTRAVIMEAPPAKRAVSLGIMQSGIGIGGVIGASLLPILGVALGWRLTIQAAASFSLIIAIMLAFIYREDVTSNTIETTGPSLGARIFSLLKDRSLLWICLLGTIYGAVTTSATAHYAVFLTDDLYFRAGIVGLGLAMVHIGGIVGRPIWGWLSDGFFGGNRGQTLFALGLMSGCLYLMIGLLLAGNGTSAAVIFLFSFLLGTTALSWIGIFFITVGEFVGPDETGMATGLALVFTRVGMLAAPPIFGLIADTSGSYQASWLAFGILIVGVAIIYRFGILGREVSLYNENET